METIGLNAIFVNIKLNFWAFSGLFIGPQIKFGSGQFREYIFGLGSKISARLPRRSCVTG